VIPYYSDDTVTLWHGDMRAIVPTLDVRADCVIADPPYGETSLAWDRWPDGWPAALAAAGLRSMWCFGSMRMFLDRRDEFTAWRLSQDVVWEKHDGSGFATDRFRRVHEQALHYYRGEWSSLTRTTPRVGVAGPDKSVRRVPVAKGHHGDRGPSSYVDDGTRLMRSVIKVRNMHARNLHPTEKPAGILQPLLEYACPEGGLVLDPFAGSGSTAVAARMTGRRAVLIEADERYCEVIARRLAQDVLPIGGA
jgi:site-specific DNA-methyltransferase (adenine-specific)